MFQDFGTVSHPEFGPERLAKLRAALKARNLDGFIVPRADRFQGEYVADCDARLSWLTGFTGSAGFCVVLPEIAGVFIDGRYRTQVKSQVDLAHFTPVPWPEQSAADWIKSQSKGPLRLGIDPWLHTVQDIRALESGLKGTGVEIVVLEENPLDAIWVDRPAPPAAPAVDQPLEFAGEPHESKIKRMATAIADAGASQSIITQPDAICWLLNVRGADIPRNPVVHAMAVLHAAGHVDLFTDPTKFNEVAEKFGPSVALDAESEMPDFVAALKGPTLLDPATTPLALAEICAETIEAPDPCALAKACKNEVELAGADAAQLRDGVAMAEFLCWLDENAPNGTLTEIDVVTKLEAFRRASNALREISFETIAGAGEHGAIMHYRVSEGTNRPVKSGELLLVDSGGQYQDGTTDITRTIAVGEIGETEKRCFTRVLQGMIAISRAEFPKGTKGRDLDPFARMALWQAGQDFNHGTGHGVGSYLSVHEGPQRLAKTGSIALEIGMILSNEPGYYREGAFGIRIENLIAVEPAPAHADADPERDFLRFRTMTFVPIDRRLIMTSLLNKAEIDWINQYHFATWKLLRDHVSKPTRSWLKEACAPLKGDAPVPEITITKADTTYVVRAGGAVIGESQNALILKEGSLAPVAYFPREDVAMAMLEPSDHTTHCPWKGNASYFSIHTKSTVIKNAVWSYEEPLESVEEIAGYLAFAGENVAVEGL